MLITRHVTETGPEHDLEMGTRGPAGSSAAVTAHVDPQLVSMPTSASPTAACIKKRHHVVPRAVFVSTSQRPAPWPTSSSMSTSQTWDISARCKLGLVLTHGMPCAFIAC